MKKRKNLDEAIQEVKELAVNFRKRNGNSSLRIPNKDINLWIVNKLIEQDGRIIRVETITKILATLFCGLIIKILIF